MSFVNYVSQCVTFGLAGAGAGACLAGVGAVPGAIYGATSSAIQTPVSIVLKDVFHLDDEKTSLVTKVVAASISTLASFFATNHALGLMGMSALSGKTFVALALTTGLLHTAIFVGVVVTALAVTVAVALILRPSQPQPAHS